MKTAANLGVHFSMLAMLSATACVVGPGFVGKLDSSTDGGTSEGESTDPASGSGGVDDGTETDGGTGSGSTDAPACCETPGGCKDDVDGDGVPLSEDNAPGHFNPEQTDQDGDGIPDVMDICAHLANEFPIGDSDKDGIGNLCDRCSRPASHFNESASALAVPYYMRVRSIPLGGDFDHDGIGDACDNCVAVSNCEDWGFDNHAPLGTQVDPFGPDCQRDDDENMVGDACQGMVVTPYAAGPVGLGPTDDFDQDGIVNEADGCPRLPLSELDHVTCTDDTDCPSGRTCEIVAGADEGACNHPDTDGDGVGDICDTCPFVANPEQVIEGAAQADDEDGDFVGQACELGPGCEQYANPRRRGFYRVSVNGQCCTTALRVDDAGQVLRWSGEPLFDPDGVPLRLSCTQAQEDAGECRVLPPSVQSTPGMLELPPGCAEALADVNMTQDDNVPLTLEDLEYADGDPRMLDALSCYLPPLDHDFDGLADACDLCPFAFDPQNMPYIDAKGRLWPDNGKYCEGEYAPGAICE